MNPHPSPFPLVRLVWIGLFALLVASSAPTNAADVLRVCLISRNGSAEALRTALSATLEKSLGAPCVVTTAGRHSDGTLSLDTLRSANVAVFHRGPGPLSAGDATILRDYLGSGHGCVILGAARGSWDAVPDFFPQVLGTEPREAFAGGAPMTVINLFPHPIYAGVVRFETTQPMTAYVKLVGDAQMIMEGTVGEETTPLAWVRRLPGGRMCHLVPAEAALFTDSAYVQIVTNAVLWTTGRPVPNALPAIQRTFMPESHPGSFAITFPNGPSVCLDPVRGGINYIWDGDFVDLRPRWLTKQGEPARIAGKIFYREKLWQPLREGAPSRVSEFHFRGYALKQGQPEFHYEIDGRDVFETLSASPDGTTLTRHFRVGAGRGSLWITPESQPDADVVHTGLTVDGPSACFASTAAGEFTIVIRRKTGGATP